MKRKTIFSFVLIALLLIGIGYAAISDHLEVGGTVNTDCAELNLVFTEAVEVVDERVDVNRATNEGKHLELGGTGAVKDQAEDKAQTKQAYANIKNDRVELVVNNMAHKGDTVVFELTIKNISAAEDMIAELSAPVVAETEGAQYFTATAEYKGVTSIGQDQEAILVVTVQLDRSVSEANISGKFTIDLTGTYTMSTAAQ